ncbi:MAG: hypothetical protein K6E48_05125 [Lachnospiraceae bacterium]|nr:hypothetical protein [Lachnospiraceae bacterium]
MLPQQMNKTLIINNTPLKMRGFARVCAGLRKLSLTFLVYKKYSKMARWRKVWHITAMKRSKNRGGLLPS